MRFLAILHPIDFKSDLMIDILVNGSTLKVDSGAFLSEVLVQRGISIDTARGIAVALDDKIVRRLDWNSTPIEPGAHIEIVTARQGG